MIVFGQQKFEPLVGSRSVLMMVGQASCSHPHNYRLRHRHRNRHCHCQHHKCKVWKSGWTAVDTSSERFVGEFLQFIDPTPHTIDCWENDSASSL